MMQSRHSQKYKQAKVKTASAHAVVAGAAGVGDNARGSNTVFDGGRRSSLFALVLS